MKYMLDTNTCIFAMKQKGNVVANLIKYKPEDICISSIIYAELVYGVEKSQAKDKNRFAITLFLSDIQVISYDDNVAQEYGYIRQICNKKEYLLGICPGNNYRIGIFCLCGVLFLIKIFH